MISFEEAVEYALKGGETRWKFSEYRWLKEFEGEPFVTLDGLVEGYLEWRANNGTLYEAEYPSGRVGGEVERFTGVEDTEEYYVWMTTLKDGMRVWIDARNGGLLSLSPSRVPGLLTFKTAVNIVHAPQKEVEECVVREYKRIGDFEFEPHETPDGLMKGHLLWRASNGTHYEVQLPFIRDIRGKVLYIEAPDDKEEYNVWEITTENKVYYIDARNGIIRLIIGETTPVYPTPEEVRDAVMSYIQDHYPKTARLIEDNEWNGGDITPLGPVGSVTYQYVGYGWNVTIGYVVYYDVTYEVTAENQQEGITWTGTVYDGVVSETSYEKV